jgi:hypothetical protein
MHGKHERMMNSAYLLRTMDLCRSDRLVLDRGQWRVIPRAPIRPDWYPLKTTALTEVKVRRSMLRFKGSEWTFGTPGLTLWRMHTQ